MSILLLVALVGHVVGSSLHFVHNGIFLDSYPNMPAWISELEVYGALGGLTAVGLVGYVVYLKGYRKFGLFIIAVYAVLGFDGLAHYTLAPFSAHTATMNFTIWLEVLTATILLGVVVKLQLREFAASRVSSADGA